MTDLIVRPWPWWIAGPLIGAVVPFVYWYGGKKWGVSSSLQHLCAATIPAGIGYLRYDWRRIGSWQLAMVAGIVVGGFIAARVLGPEALLVEISPATAADLRGLGLTDLTGLAPSEIFHWGALFGPAGLGLVVVGGFLVGFGSRYADGCTSGHAISGLANFQPSSFVAVVGFFVGGLLSTWVLLPLIL
jgi:uncharacterized membrane protein YedE/YeeE